MGLNESKPKQLTSEERDVREAAKNSMVQQRKADIDRVQSQMVNAVVEVKDIVAMVKVTETAKAQLDRGGGVLTKADLVAVIVGLEPSMRDQIPMLEAMRVIDLNAVIRSIIYDPKRIVSVYDPKSALDNKSAPIYDPRRAIGLNK
jgi:hypothetical protein